jgi:uncharacterized damage-inducible protein DinB
MSVTGTFPREALWHQFGAAADMLENAIVACPDALWGDRSKQPEYWYIAYHTLFFLDYYLSDTADGFHPPAPFGLEELDPAGVLPERVFTKDELLEYLRHGREKCRALIESLTDETAGEIRRFNNKDWTVLEWLVVTIRHVQHHTAQLNLILRQQTNAAPRWVASAARTPEGDGPAAIAAGTWRVLLWHHFGGAIDMLENAITACPDALWADRTRRPEFWYAAYHTLFFLDLYLSDSPDGFAPPAPFTLDELENDTLPERPYGKDELLGYLEHGRDKCRAVLGALTDEKLREVHRWWTREFSVLENLIYNMRHVQHHAAQLNLILRQQTDSAPNWVGRTTRTLAGG